MRRQQFLAFCAVGFAGCFLGGFVANVGPARANAQSQTFPGNAINPNQVQIRSENILLIPDGGLRMVNAQNRTLGVIVDQGGNGGIVLFNNQGRPSVTMIGGPAGLVEMNAQTGPSIRLTGPSGGESVSLTGGDASASLKLKEGLALTSGTEGGRVLVNDGKANASLRLESSAAGGRIVGFDKAKSSLFELTAKENEGVLSLSSKDAEPGFQAWGSGSSIIKKDRETIWKIPADGTSR